MKNLLHPSLVEGSSQLSDDFQSAPFFPHVMIEKFLDDDFCKEVSQEFPDFNASAAINESGEVGRKAHRPDVADLGPAYAKLDQLMQDADFLATMSKISGIPDLLYDPEYIGGGTHENLDGAELDVHVDFNYHPNLGWHRRLNLILFLNEEWEESWGGCLAVHDDPWSDNDQSRSFVPVFNRAVMFETNERSWHGFDRVRLPQDGPESRRTFAVYFYTKDRPAEQTASPHATVYVPNPLPPSVKAGHTLTEEDVEEIRYLVNKRDGLLRFLYHRELEFSEALEAARARLKNVEQNAIRQIVSGTVSLYGNAEGVWDDHWATGESSFLLRAEAPSKGITFEGFLPDDHKGLELTFDVLGHSQTVQPEPGHFIVTLDVPMEAGTQANLKVTGSQTWVPSCGDERQLAFVLNGIQGEAA